MRVADLSPEVIERIRSMRYDRIIEKHEGPEDWDAVFEWYGPEIITYAGHNILLPIEQERHPFIAVIRSSISADENVLTLWLMDAFWVYDAKYLGFDAARIAVCERLRGTELYVATLYHEIFLVDEMNAEAIQGDLA